MERELARMVDGLGDEELTPVCFCGFMTDLRFLLAEVGRDTIK